MPTLKEEILKAIDPHFEDGDGGAMADAVIDIFKRHIEEAFDNGSFACVNVQKEFKGESKQVVEFIKARKEYLKSKGICE